MTPQMVISDTGEAEFAAFLQACIREYNNHKSPRHLEARQPGAVKHLHLILKDETGKVIGGLSASTYWNWLEIHDFFIPEQLRGAGFGASLLHTAEAIAVERGAESSFLTTYEFQARTFYEKHGYFVVGKLEDYPPGSTYYWMRKNLVPAPARLGLPDAAETTQPH